eukprot:6009413-Ditylum_brightwellii.AAC.1
MIENVWRRINTTTHTCSLQYKLSFFILKSSQYNESKSCKSAELDSDDLQTKPILVLKSPKTVLWGAGLCTALQDIQTEIKILSHIQYKHGGHCHILHFYGVVIGQHKGNSNDDGDGEQDKDHWLTSSLSQMPPR